MVQSNSQGVDYTKERKPSRQENCRKCDRSFCNEHVILLLADPENKFEFPAKVEFSVANYAKIREITVVKN